jgi:ATP-binding cassette, subfamily B, bacterial MsbA
MLDRFKRTIQHVFLGDRPNDLNLIVRVVTENALPQWRSFARMWGLMAISAAATASFAYLFSHVINDVYFRRSFGEVALLAVVIMVLFAVKGFASYGQAVMLARVNNRITRDNQQRLFDKLVQEGMEYFVDRQSTQSTMAFTAGVNAPASILNVLVSGFGRDLMTLIGLIAVMVVQTPFMSVFAVVAMPIAVTGVRKLIKQVKQLMRTEFARAADIYTVLHETMKGFRVVKAFNMEDALSRRIAHDILSIEAAANKLARASNRSAPMMEALGGCAIGLVLLYAGYLIIEQGAAPGQFLSFIGAFLLAYEPAKRLARMNIDLAGLLVGSRILYDALDSPPAEGDDSDKPALAVTDGQVEFADVEFSYRPGEPVLQRTSFVAEPGKVTALVGPSGGGKSTIFSLLLDFYRPQGGAIIVDGQKTRDVTRKSVRASIAYVGQEPFLFHGTIRDNIMCGKPGATEAELIAAARAAYAHDFVMSFPLGYDAQVGEVGSQLSLGQRQRIAIARALIKNAPIILLDEATASLDSESEVRVKEALGRLCAGKTTLVIAHRLNTIVDADCIHVVEKGAIVESDQHQELLRREGRYATFFRLQFPGERERPVIAAEPALS